MALYNFRLNLYGISFLASLLVILSAVLTIIEFIKRFKISGFLMIPYIALVIYTSILNYYIWLLNEVKEKVAKATLFLKHWKLSILLEYTDVSPLSTSPFKTRYGPVPTKVRNAQNPGPLLAIYTNLKVQGLIAPGSTAFTTGAP